jgi:hypothetical protein
MMTLPTPVLSEPPLPPRSERDDRLLAPTLWTARIIVPVLVAAFVILYFFPGDTMRLWSWMICPEMSALVMGAGYLAGAWFFSSVARTRQWHRVAPGFVATTVFTGLLLATTVLHWEEFNYDHVSFWAWIGLYATTPFLLPLLWRNNQRTDPGGTVASPASSPTGPAPGEARVPRPLRVVVGVGGALQLAVAVLMFVRPSVVEDTWPWELQPATSRSLAAFIAFPAVTWLWFLFEDRWSSFRITQQTATIGLALIGIGALRARGEFRDGWESPSYVVALVLALVLNIVLYVAMERRARVGAARTVDGVPAA